MKKKSIFLSILLAAIILTFISCKHNLTGFDPSEYSYGSWQLLRESQNDGHYWNLFFVNKYNGWATGDSGKIIHTTDGGVSWEYQQTPLKKLVYTVSFINPNEGWVCGENKILHTANGGRNWEILFADLEKSKFGMTDTSYKYYQQVYFKDKMNGWAVNESGELRHSSDGGYHWIKQAEWQFGGPAEICFVDNANGFIMNPDNVLLITSDGGDSWTEQKVEGIHFTKKIKFINKNFGWIITQTIASSTMQRGSPIYNTINGGYNWTFKDTIYDGGLTSIAFANSLLGWISGSRGIYQTVDGGNTWKTDSSLLDKYFFQKVFAVDDRNVWALDFSGRIFKFIPGY